MFIIFKFNIASAIHHFHHDIPAIKPVWRHNSKVAHPYGLRKCKQNQLSWFFRYVSYNLFQGRLLLSNRSVSQIVLLTATYYSTGSRPFVCAVSYHRRSGMKTERSLTAFDQTVSCSFTEKFTEVVQKLTYSIPQEWASAIFATRFCKRLWVDEDNGILNSSLISLLCNYWAI